MPEALNRTELVDALAALGAKCRGRTTLLLGGSAALILRHALDRGTNDGDVLTLSPGLDRLQAAIRAVAHDRGLPDGWLNGSVQSYAEVLPPDYASRVTTLPPFGRLSVSLVSRKDVIVMKFFSGRPKDIRTSSRSGQQPPSAALRRTRCRALRRSMSRKPSGCRRCSMYGPRGQADEWHRATQGDHRSGAVRSP